MQMMSSLMVIVGVVLVGLAMAYELPNDGTLIAHQQPTEELSREQLVGELNKISSDDRNREVPLPDVVAELLYKAKDKDSTEVRNGVTVADLIEQNNFHPLEDCSQVAFKKRASIYAKIYSKDHNQYGLVYGVNVYFLRTLHLAARYCIKHKEEVVSKGINDKFWLPGLDRSMFWSGQSERNSDASHLSSIEEAARHGDYALVVRYIENSLH